METERIQQLASAHLDGRISDADFAELQQLLTAEGGAREMYAELARLDAALQETAIDEKIASQSESRPSSSWSQLPKPLQLLLVVAAVLLVFLPTWRLLQENEMGDDRGASKPESAITAPVRSIAVISAQADAVWQESGKQRLGAGSPLTPGKLTLAEGLAQIDFFCGASITLTGPAEIDLRNSKLAILHSGRLRADVPPAARGFEIRTADVRLEDLGTSFGVVTRANGDSDVIVFDGEVRAVDSVGNSVSLLAGDTAHLSAGELAEASPTAVGDFPDISAIIKKSGGLNESRYARWKVAAAQRCQDPRLIAYYDFEDLTKASRRLPNQAVIGNGSELDGGIVGARVSEGRWPGKTALDFRGEGDRVRFNIPGEFDALTLYAWVRIDALDRRMNSLFLTDYYDPGEIHWQLSMRGALHFATSPVGVPSAPQGQQVPPNQQIQAENRRFWSDEFWDASQSGKWFLLATTVDRKQRTQNTVAHYINGRRVGFSGGSNMDRQLPKLRIGGADLGNWTDPIWPTAIRSLNGRIDEFAIYSAALSAEEIHGIYEQGEP